MPDIILVRFFLHPLRSEVGVEMSQGIRKPIWVNRQSGYFGYGLNLGLLPELVGDHGTNRDRYRPGVGCHIQSIFQTAGGYWGATVYFCLGVTLGLDRYGGLGIGVRCGLVLLR